MVRMGRERLGLLNIIPFLSIAVSAVQLNVNNQDSIKHAAKAIATDMMSYYVGNEPGQTPGMLPSPYYWWHAGSMFGSMIDYWYFTGDDHWNSIVRQAIVWQADKQYGGIFQSKNITNQLGNDDQAFWAFAAMSAAEYKFENPPKDQPQWLAMAQGVFNAQVGRWDHVCGGGLRWQVNHLGGGLNGYYYKNSISNGCLFQLGARLYKYTGNETYAHWAEKAYNWTASVKLIDDDYAVFDGVSTTTCNMKGHTERWTYNVGVFMYGCAAMWNMTKDDIWKERVEGFLNASAIFFKTDQNGHGILTEVICEPEDSCEIDDTFFKGFLAQWMYATAKVAPWSSQRVHELLQYSPPAAAQSCSQPGQAGGYECGQEWYLESFDSRVGVGEDLSALETIQGLLPAPGPVDHVAGISKGDASAGSSATEIHPDSPLAGTSDVNEHIYNINTGDRAGAWILTVLFGLGSIVGGWWLIKEDSLIPWR